ncbi:MAG: Arc family DNA-binding protein [Roseibium sp.]|uniref:Arc family DNA-binding protein n=1 Tax=Roseibium sp. TaxID=1936156 RepID=UPI001B20BD22|nr:Arc family DNA-binding protein [Roseibium sp.]MBO6508277.1 Arc family DNA-binding protein [Roseibium sp.]MBO6892286.1 Arc family DNA-binding protein [Roseibium sp.]MBO6929889.1 Arc family DNA-binding protein [Roseibium sp.]
MAREDPQLKLRLPEELKNRIASAAKKSGRSMNAEIVSRLETSIGFEDEYGTLEEVMQETWKDIEELKAKVSEHDQHLFPNRYDWD